MEKENAKLVFTQWGHRFMQRETVKITEKARYELTYSHSPNSIKLLEWRPADSDRCFF